MRRLFLAVDLAIHVVEQLAVFREEFQEEHPDVEIDWVAPTHLRVPLRYWGDLDETIVSLLIGCLEEMVKPLFPFEISCQGVGSYPIGDRPRIVWAGMDKKAGEVMGLLAQAVERDLEQIGLAPEVRGYEPLICLGRMRSPSSDLPAALENHAERTFGTTYARDLVLFEAISSPSGPRFEVQERFLLGDRQS